MSFIGTLANSAITCGTYSDIMLYNANVSNVSINDKRRLSSMLFTNATIVTMNPMRYIITDGAIAVNGNRIAAIGKTDALSSQYRDEEVIDVKGKLIIPGLIDTHVHVAQALIRGCADDMALIQWLCERVWSYKGISHTMMAMLALVCASPRCCVRARQPFSNRCSPIAMASMVLP